MKTFTTLIASFFLVLGSLSAQRVIINSPSELAGSYEFGTTGGNWGADLTSDIWTGDAEFIDDGTASPPNQGCNAAVNDLTGKIGLIDRGSCEFGAKALNAENAGAIAAIIVNNAPGAGVQDMGAGAVGGQVTIPVVLISYELGQEIRTAMMTGPVNISIGDIRFDNDISITGTSVLNAPLGIVPVSQIGDTNFIFNPGGLVTNRGLNAASGVTISSTIEHTPLTGGAATEVYNESGSLSGSLDTDSSSALVVLPSYQPGNGTGVYTVNYSIAADNEDDAPNDNSVTSAFTVSENLYSKASWNPETGNPRVTANYRRLAGPEMELLTYLNIPNGMGYTIDSVVFNVTTSTGLTLADIQLDVYVYEWNDLNADAAVGNDEIAVAGFNTYIFPSDETAGEATLRVPLLDFNTVEETGVAITENNKYYIVGVRYQGTGDVFFGFDLTYDYLQYLELEEDNGTLTDFDYGYLLVSQWDDILPNIESAGIFTDLFAASSTGVILTPTVSSTEEVVGEDVFKMELFPNPVAEQLTATINFRQNTSFVEYHITDASGRRLFNTRDNDVMDKEQALFNVKALPSGQYFLTIRTEQGIQTKPFVVKR